MAAWGYLPKLKGGLGLAFDAHFLHDQRAKFQCHTSFASQDIKQNVLSSSYLDS